MKKLQAFLGVALLAAAVPAQISSKDILITEQASTYTLGLSLLDHTTGKARLVKSLTGGPYHACALDHRAPATVGAPASVTTCQREGASYVRSRPT